MKIRTLIVDDEPLAREGIRLRLSEESDMEVVGEYGNGPEALAAIFREQPDLVFLDVQMPGMDGFEVLAHIGPEHMPAIIFVTAYDKYALQAFDVHALDYLLKPIDGDRFAASLDRVRETIRHNDLTEAGKRLLVLLNDLGFPSEPSHSATEVEEFSERPERFVIKSRGRVYFLRVDEIDWIEAAGDYVCLHAGRTTHLLRQTMTAMETQLDSRHFQRIHRSTVVNLNRVRELRPADHGEYTVYLFDGTELKLSRSYRETFQKNLGMTF